MFLQTIIFINLSKKIKQIPHVEINDELSGRIAILENLATSQKQTNSAVSERIDSIIPLLSTIDHHATIRYNPFKDAGVGGKQSFSTALINKNGSGIILTNLFSRELSRVSIKEIENWTCTDHELSLEEKEVLDQIKTA